MLKKRKAARRRTAAPRPRGPSAVQLLDDVLVTLERMERAQERDRDKLIGIEKLLGMRGGSFEAENMAGAADALDRARRGEPDDAEIPEPSADFMARLDQIYGASFMPPKRPSAADPEEAVDDEETTP